jgi:peptidyl-Lys metalloendopeptidase
VLVTVTLSNPHKHTVRVLKWFTADVGVEEPLFAVTRDGEPVAYLGAHYKRPEATGKDYVSLKAGKSISYTVNLADSYDLSQSDTWGCVRSRRLQLFDERSLRSRISDLAPVSMKVEGRVESPLHFSIRLRVPIRSTPAAWINRPCLLRHVTKTYSNDSRIT